MRLINTKVHALLDYLLSLVLAGSPWLFKFPPSGLKYQVPLAVGVIAAALALTTRFEFSVVKIISLRLHLVIDVFSGLLLAASPWLFDFKEIVFKPHLVFGLTHAIVAVITDRMLYDKMKGIKVRTDSEGNVLEAQDPEN
jgi:hypothetical protein